MGMDVLARKGDGAVHYNWTGWARLCTHLPQWGVDTSELAGVNDGDVISANTCRKIADAIERNISSLSAEDQEWLREHPALWRKIAEQGGGEQW